jgi:tRNA-dihydrouridine synthase B
MRVPDEALKLIDAVVAATPLPVTVKMRLGWDEESMNAAELARRAVDAGAQMITVHGRTRQQFYKGEARWELVRPVVETVNVPVVVNGDIVDLAAAREALEQSGAAAVMIGRGAQGQPWVPGQVGAELDGAAAADAPAGDELVALILEHYDMMLTDYGTTLGVRVARKHLDWYLEALGIVLAKDTRKALLNAESPAEVIDMIPAIYGGEWRQAA